MPAPTRRRVPSLDARGARWMWPSCDALAWGAKPGCCFKRAIARRSKATIPRRRLPLRPAFPLIRLRWPLVALGLCGARRDRGRRGSSDRRFRSAVLGRACCSRPGSLPAAALPPLALPAGSGWRRSLGGCAGVRSPLGGTAALATDRDRRPPVRRRAGPRAGARTDGRAALRGGDPAGAIAEQEWRELLPDRPRCRSTRVFWHERAGAVTASALGVCCSGLRRWPETRRVANTMGSSPRQLAPRGSVEALRRRGWDPGFEPARSRCSRWGLRCALDPSGFRRDVNPGSTPEYVCGHTPIVMTQNDADPTGRQYTYDSFFNPSRRPAPGVPR